MKARVSVKFQANYTDVRLVVSTNSSLTNPITSNAFATSNLIAKLEIDGLAPNTQYYYGVSVGGTLQTGGRGQFKTFPNTPASFKFAFSSCCQSGTNPTVFDDIRNQNPLFFVHMGDLHYADIATNSISAFRSAYDGVFNQSRQAQLYANVPTMYTYDDHDFGANNSDSTSPSRPAALAAYKEFVPHYPLVTGDEGVGQSWVVGRVRFIMPDQQHAKTSRTATDDANKTAMGETQIQWFFNQLLQPEPLKIWCNNKPWTGAAISGEDGWQGYTTERRRIADFIKANNLTGRVAIISGDMHALGIDDGTASSFATGGGGNIPVFQGSPLNNSSSIKGGSYSHGTNTSNGQFGLVEITDAGTSADIVMTWKGMAGSTQVLTYSMNVPSAPYTAP